MKSYIPCDRLKSNLVLFGGTLGVCCGDGGRKTGPRFACDGDGIESIKRFLESRELLFQELNGLREIDLLRPCLGCRDLAENTGERNARTEKIRYINLSYMPTVCQCKCIYCPFAWSEADNNYELAKQAKFAPKFAGIMNYLEENGFLSDKPHIQVSSGEITIHPERDELLAIVAKYPCYWLTNAFVYDESIAQNLSCNNSSSLCVSLDCGTPETFKRVKGYDMFDKVVENLLRYNERGAVRIKYIVIPGVNDSIADYNGIISLLKKFGHTQLNLSYDTFLKPSPYEVLESSALLYSMCRDNGIHIPEGVFPKAEADEIKTLIERGFGAQELEAYENNEARRHFRGKELACNNFGAEYRYYFLERSISQNMAKIKEFLSTKTCVIWGAGANGSLFASLCQQNDIDIYITDSNKLKHGSAVSGKVVVPFTDIADKVDIILLSNGSFFDSVRTQVGDKYEIINFWSLVPGI